MVNKKGWIRIVEASIAILIIFAVIVSVSQIRKARAERDLSEIISPLLEEIAKNNSMRESIIKDDKESGDAENMAMLFLSYKIRAETNLGYSFRICEIDEICGLEIYPTDISGNIYAGSRIISSSLTVAKPKKIAIFLWLRK
ncbi:MAG: hypothetical protein QXS38_00515 [Candidatus Pacearchaeota archaeon]